MDAFAVLQLAPSAPRPLLDEVYWMLIAAANGAPFTAETHARINAINEAYREIIHTGTTPAAVVAPPRRVEQRLFGKPRVVLERSTHYEALHVASLAESSVLDVAHRVISGSYAPGSLERARVDDAYRVLREPESRARYDRALGIRHEAEAPAPEDSLPAERPAPAAASNAAPASKHAAAHPKRLLLFGRARRARVDSSETHSTERDRVAPAASAGRGPAESATMHLPDLPQTAAIISAPAVAAVAVDRNTILAPRTHAGDRAAVSAAAAVPAVASPAPAPADEPATPHGDARPTGAASFDALNAAGPPISAHAAEPRAEVAAPDSTTPMAAHAPAETPPASEVAAPESAGQAAKNGAGSPRRRGLFGLLAAREAPGPAATDRLQSDRRLLELAGFAVAPSPRPEAAAIASIDGPEPPPALAQLVITDGEEAGRCIPLGDSVVALRGADPSGLASNPVELAWVWRHRRGFALRANSAAPLRVNGESLSLPVVLLDDGDEISTGFQTVVFRSQAPATGRQLLDTATE